jgi:hypothetical protein
MGVATSQKWFTLGRHSYELYLVMPDNKTVYSSDDGTNTAFYKFVMDTPGDMSSGSLYGAKLFQQSAMNGGDFVVCKLITFYPALLLVTAHYFLLTHLK